MSAPDWLNNAILKGFQGLLMLRLQFAPAQDTIPHTLNAWLAVLMAMPHTWDEERDAPRIRRAFLTMAADCDRWPAPKNFIDALPSLPDLNKLTAPATHHTPESKRMVKDLLTRLGSKHA